MYIFNFMNFEAIFYLHTKLAAINQDQNWLEIPYATNFSLFYDHHLTIFFLGSSSCSLVGFVRQEMTFINQFQHFRFSLWLFFAYWAEMGASWRLVCPSMVVTCPANFKVWFLLVKMVQGGQEDRICSIFTWDCQLLGGNELWTLTNRL